MADIELTCKDCGSTFVFTEGEQAFYQEKGFLERLLDGCDSSNRVVCRGRCACFIQSAGL